MFEKTDAVALGLIVLSAYVAMPFSDALIFGFVTAYGLRFLVDLMAEFMDRRVAESVLLVSFLALVAGIVYFAVSNASTLVSALVVASQTIAAGIRELLAPYNLPGLEESIGSTVAFVNTFLRQNVAGFLRRVPWLVAEVLVYVLTVITVYREGHRLESLFFSVLDRIPDREAEDIKEVLYGVKSLLGNIFVVYGTFSVLMGAATAVGYYVIGMLVMGRPVPFFWLWGLLVALAAFLQGLGSIIFTGPLIGYYFFTGNLAMGAWLLGFQVVVLTVFPQLMLPYFGASRLQESFMVMILGFLAGPLVFGLKGIILGPVFLITLKKLLVASFYES